MYISDVVFKPIIFKLIIPIVLFFACWFYVQYGVFVFCLFIYLFFMKEKIRTQPLIGTTMQFCGCFFIFAAFYVIPGIHLSANISRELYLLFGSALPPITLFYLFLFLSALCFALGYTINLLYEISLKLSQNPEKGS